MALSPSVCPTPCVSARVCPPTDKLQTQADFTLARIGTFLNESVSAGTPLDAYPGALCIPVGASGDLYALVRTDGEIIRLWGQNVGI